MEELTNEEVKTREEDVSATTKEITVKKVQENSVEAQTSSSVLQRVREMSLRVLQSEIKYRPTEDLYTQR